MSENSYFRGSVLEIEPDSNDIFRKTRYSDTLLVILFITTTSMVSIGLIIGSRMESPEGFQLITSFLLFPIFFLSGALFPLNKLPAWLGSLTLIDPLTYSVDSLRSVILGASQFSLVLDSGTRSLTAGNKSQSDYGDGRFPKAGIFR